MPRATVWPHLQVSTQAGEDTGGGRLMKLAPEGCNWAVAKEGRRS